MKLLDLSHPIHPGMPVYPGTAGPCFSRPCTIAKEGFLEHRYAINSHTGTHIDAPAHIFPAGMTLDQLPMEAFTGRGLTADCTAGLNSRIEIADLLPYEEQLAQADFLLLHTGWGDKWLSPAYFSGFPVLTSQAASWLAQFGLKGIGTDTISIDQPAAVKLSNHQLILGRGTIIIENLAHLNLLPRSAFTFYCLPLPVKDADGAPTRAFAVL